MKLTIVIHKILVFTVVILFCYEMLHFVSVLNVDLFYVQYLFIAYYFNLNNKNCTCMQPIVFETLEYEI